MSGAAHRRRGQLAVMTAMAYTLMLLAQVVPGGQSGEAQTLPMSGPTEPRTWIALDRLVPNNYRPLVPENVTSIRKDVIEHGWDWSHGVLVVRRVPDGRYEILSGNHRYEVARLLGTPELPCEVVEVTDDEALMVSVRANRNRADAPASAEGEAFRRLRDRGVPVPDIAKGCGAPPSRVKRCLDLVDELDPTLWELADQRSLSFVEVLYGLPAEDQRELCARVEVRNINVRQWRAIAETHRSERAIQALFDTTPFEMTTQQWDSHAEELIDRTRDMRTPLLSIKGVVCLPHCLRFSRTPSIRTWRKVARRLRAMDEAQQWWWGDLWNCMIHHHGERSDQAAATGHELQWLRIVARVCRAYPAESGMRVLLPYVTFEHHRRAVRLAERTPALAHALLLEAAERRWSSREVADRAAQLLVEPESVGIGADTNAKLSAPNSTFPVLLVSAPWINEVGFAPDGGRTDRELAKMPPPADDDAVIFIRCPTPEAGDEPSAALRRAERLATRWGFTPCDAIPYLDAGDTPRSFVDRSLRYLLVAVRGEFSPPDDSFKASINLNSRDNSGPDFHTLIDKMLPEHAKAEVWPRGPGVQGWGEASGWSAADDRGYDGPAAMTTVGENPRIRDVRSKS